MPIRATLTNLIDREYKRLPAKEGTYTAEKLDANSAESAGSRIIAGDKNRNGIKDAGENWLFQPNHSITFNNTQVVKNKYAGNLSGKTSSDNFKSITFFTEGVEPNDTSNIILNDKEYAIKGDLSNGRNNKPIKVVFQEEAGKEGNVEVTRNEIGDFDNPSLEGETINGNRAHQTRITAKNVSAFVDTNGNGRFDKNEKVLLGNPTIGK